MDEPTAFERHSQSVLAVVITGLLTWAGWSISGLKETAIRMEGQIAVVRTHVDGLTEQLRMAATERYRSTQAASDFALRDAARTRLEERVTSLEAWAKEASKHITEAKGG